MVDGKKARLNAMARDLNKALGIGGPKGEALRPGKSEGFVQFLEPIPGAYRVAKDYRPGGKRVYRLYTEDEDARLTSTTEWMPFAEFVEYLYDRIKVALRPRV